MTIDLAGIRKKAEAATKGEWFADGIKSDGAFGSGEDVSEGFQTYAIFTDAIEHFGSHGVVCDALNNSGVATIEVEYDEYGAHAWDEQARRDMDFIVAAQPATVLALIDRIEALTEALRPFDRAASALFTRNYNKADVVVALPVDASHPNQLRLTAEDFFAVRTTLEGSKP